jgi:signal transduction histidine kinase
VRVSGISLMRWLWRPAGRLPQVGWGDIALAAFLSGFAVILVGGVLPQPAGTAPPGAIPALAVLAMTVPVAWERQFPVVAAAAVAAGALLNELVIGPMIRCGPGLPAVFVIAFFAGTRLTGRMLVLATTCCAAAVTLQSFYDPQLGASFLFAALPAVAAACLAGHLARSRSMAAAALRERNAELREQREQTARLAVAADRARVAADLDVFLRDQITAMAAVAASGRELITADPDRARDAFGAVESSGRATLAQMREVVGTLREEDLTGPQPVLAELGDLLESATAADARLRVEGSPRALPAGVELSAYRIVEHLLTALQDTPEARIDVLLRFGKNALELQVAGPASPHSDPGTALTVARERVALLGGSLRIETGSGRYAALVKLPLTATYAYS